MRNFLIYLALLTFCFSVCMANDTMVVRNLTVEDDPFDGGNGLIIKFDALPRTARIIEYRIYRGVTPNTLYYLGSVEVNANSGVASGEVVFYDNDYRTFADLTSPRRLRQEKGQRPGSPIFQALPRDVSVVGPLLEHFDVLGIIKKEHFYRKTTRHLIPSDEGGQQLLGGLRIEDFETILSGIKTGKEYFYTVIAVDERRNFHPYAPIVSGIASDDIPMSFTRYFLASDGTPMPETNFYNVWLEDTQTLNFEFDYPLSMSDIYQASIYMIQRSEIDALARYREFMNELSEWNRLATIGDTTAVRPETVDRPGRLLQSVSTSFNYCFLHFEDGFLINDTDGSLIEFNPNLIDDYMFFITLDDFGGFQSVSEPIETVVKDSSDLPVLPSFIVRDKPNDKGDANEIIIGKPLVQLTRISFRNRLRDRRRLTFSYDYSAIPTYKIKDITFRFVDNNGNTFDTITEHFIDNVFNLDLPSEMYFFEGFKVYMSFNAPGTDIHQVPFLSQTIIYDEDLLMLRPSNLFSDDEEMLMYRYQIVKQSLASNSPGIQSKITPLINFFDDFIPYETHIYKMIESFDLERNQFLFETSIDIGFDSDFGTHISTNLFYQDFVNITRQQIAEFEARIAFDLSEEDESIIPEEDVEALWMIDYLNGILDVQASHPVLGAINQLSNHKERISKLIEMRETKRRSYRYYIVKTDGKALFSISDVYVDENGNDYIFPTPDWFNTNSFPMLISSLIFTFFVFYCYRLTKSGKDLFIRPIAGIEEIDNAIGRATEMGRPMLFVPGFTSIDDVATLAALSILGHVTKKAAQYDTKIIVPCGDYIVLPIAQQIVKESYSVAGRPDSYDANDVFFVAFEQFAYVAGVNGIMIRQKTATNFYMGYFFAEALVMTETGNMTGAIQVAGTDAVTQIPFFITTCDYTLIGEELYAASAYLSKDPMILGTLKSQDYTKLIIILCIFVGTILSTINVTGMINWFPAE